MKPDLKMIDKTLLSGRTVLITEGSEGIGEALAKVFLKAGANVAVGFKNEGQHERLAKIFESAEKPYMLIHIPEATKEAVDGAVSRIESEIGSIDILVNHSDFFEDIPFSDTDESAWDYMMDVRLKSAYRFCSRVAPKMMEKKYGRIINISSLFAKTGGFPIGAGVHYCAAQAGLIGLSKGLAIKLAPFGITVNSVCPSLVDTETEKTRDAKEIDKIKEDIPFDRFADPLEIAGGVLFLSSGHTGWITGYSLDINGGLFMD